MEKKRQKKKEEKKETCNEHGGFEILLIGVVAIGRRVTGASTISSRRNNAGFGSATVPASEAKS